ncbi:fam11a [Anaeramoeba flamelloides]|uniref:Fam11a n=1 Tax=Anaeramoeba flamelloides TaxID=1746091 RepID=A0ABQ8XPN2_9EUKA|nr:fam11a [Anaeramoeba flamelloides]
MKKTDLNLKYLVHDFTITEKEIKQELKTNQYFTIKGKSCVLVRPKALLDPYEFTNKNSLSQCKTLMTNINNTITDLPIEKLWRRLCYKYNEYFIWKKLILGTVYIANDLLAIYGVQEDLLEKVTGVKTQLQVYNKIKPAKMNFGITAPRIRAPAISNDGSEGSYGGGGVGYNNTQPSTLNSFQKSATPRTSKRIRINYLKTIRDPESELINKIDQLKEIQKQRVLETNRLNKQQIINQEQRIFDRNLLKWIAFPLITLLFGFVFFSVLLSLKVQKIIISPNWFWVMSPILIPVSIILIILMIHSVKNGSINIINKILIYHVVIILIFAPLVALALKLCNCVSFNWKTTFIPIIVLLVVVCFAFIWFVVAFFWQYSIRFSILIIIGGSISLMMIPLFFILLGMKLDQNFYHLSYLQVFSPLLFLDLFPMVSVFIIFILSFSGSIDATQLLSFFCGINVIMLPFSTFEVLCLAYLQTSLINNFIYVMIPLIIIEILLLFGGIVWLKDNIRQFFTWARR